uniref:Cadherin domain-containing protein n=1 Tax=Ciona savignyi TaxID=51511 RepID=H2YCE5_CIOSA
ISNHVIQLLASDPRGRPLTFSVKGDIGPKYFTVDTNTGVVKLRKAFDREVDNQYTAKFNVSNGLYEVDKLAYITITDVNDNAPLFDHNPYIANVPEDSPIGSEILRIAASDPDSGFGGIVQFSIAEIGELPFRLDPDSGVMTLQSELDYERLPSYRFDVIARDQDDERPMSSSVAVVIMVDDVQDTEPRFVGLPYDRTIKEDVERGTRVVTISAVDGDRGRPNDVVYSFVSGNNDGKFLLDSSGDVRVASRIDRDVIGFNGKYKLTISATEIGTRGLRGGAFSEISFDVTIDDVNDERPRFERGSYRIRVPETTAVGTSLPLVIRLEDNDQGANSDVTMSVEWEWSRSIAISPVTFRSRSDVTLILTKPLDYESQRRIQFRIFANETNDPSLFSECDITIDVIDENDNAPLFDNTEYHVNVSENTEVGDVIFRASASDGDSGKFGRIFYSLEDALGDVTIGRKSGEIRLATTLDYEAQKTKRFCFDDVAFFADDTKRNLRISIDDVNDNAPLFTKSIYYVTLKENARLRHFRVEATDADNGDAGIVTYQISGGNDKGVFSINNVTGDVTNVKILDYEKLGGHVTLDVTAQDGGTDVRHSTTAQVVIRIDDVNDNPPKFPRSTQTSFQVQENIFGPKIAKFTAYDVDSGDNGRVTYSIVSGNDDSIFTISPLDGELRIAHGVELDREQRSDYNVTILAMDGGENPLNDTIVTQIHVVDTNDNSPQLTKFPNRINLSEDTVIGYPVYRVVALDPDSGNFGQMEFSIDDVDKTFSINKKSGQIYLVKSLDRESVSEYNLHVIVRDNPSDLSNSRTSRRTLQIIVDDVNDETPQFVGIPYIGEITENSPPGTQTSPILAVDADDGANSYVTYSIVTSSYFVIDHQTGTLRTIVNIDREEMLDDVIEVTVRASDGTMTSETVARVTVKDLNDNPPRFASRRVRTRVPEDMTCCRVIARMSASDPDKDDNGRLFYTIVSGAHDRFVVDRETGIISVAPGQSLDREMTSQYKLVVRATDHAANPLSSTAVVMVTVDDVNDSRPRFLSTFQQISMEIPEDAEPGSFVTSVTASDRDDAAYGDVTYTLHGDLGFFTIHPNLVIASSLAKPLDREIIPEHQLTIVASDNARGTKNNRRTTTKKVVMTLSDVNDNVPIFTGPLVTSFEVFENSTPGSLLSMVTAADRDHGRFGHVTYSL